MNINTNIPATILDNFRKNKASMNYIKVDQKKAAIETHEPLVLVNAGDNIGKLGVMLNRIDYMTSSDIGYDTILVVSPTNADVENMKATNRFVGNMTIHDLAGRIAHGNPIRYKNIIINGLADGMEDELIVILQFVSENSQSLFIIDDATYSNMMKNLIDSNTFTVYNL